MMRRMLFALLAVALTWLQPAAATTPGPVSTAGVLASPNVELLLNIPDAGSIGGRFAGGYFFTTTVTGLRIYDVADPAVPTLVSVLPLPHWENEDVDVSVSRKLVLVSLDSVTSRVPVRGALFVISWLDPSRPVLLSRLEYPATMANGREVSGTGHVANCIADCKRYAYVVGAGDGSIHVVDLANPAAPKIAGTISQQANPSGKGNDVFKGGTVHDVNTDSTGAVWVVGSGGTAQLDVRNPLKPKAVRWVSPADNKKTNHFIHHNSMRLDRDTLLVTEEDYPAMCGEVDGANEGSFQTWRIDNRKTGAGALTPLDEWETELGTYLDGQAAVTSACSSHWFTVNRHKVAAVAWYDQGVRFLDVSNPRNIRQVGYWIRPSSGLGASQALYVPGREDIVYVADYQRGLDVLRIDAGGKNSRTVRAPVRAEWIASPETTGVRFARPHPVYGYACLAPAV